MGIDKFGRSSHVYARNSRPGPKGDGFLLDSNGNYLVSNKRIRQLQDPTEGQDAVNKQWLESKLEQIHEHWKETMNFGQLCMEKINRLESKIMLLENRIDKLEKSRRGTAQG